MLVGIILFNKLDPSKDPFVYFNGEVRQETDLAILTKEETLWVSNLTNAALRYGKLSQFKSIKPNDYFGVSLNQMLLEQGENPLKLSPELYSQKIYPHLIRIVDIAEKLASFYNRGNQFDLFCSHLSFSQVCHELIYKDTFPNKEYNQLTQKKISYTEIIRPDIVHSRNILDEYSYLSVSYSRLAYARNILSTRTPKGIFYRLSDPTPETKKALLNDTKPFIASLKNFSFKKDVPSGELVSSLLAISSHDHHERRFYPSPEVKLLKNYADFELDDVFVSDGDLEALNTNIKKEVWSLIDASPEWEAGIIAFNLWSSGIVERFFTLPSKKTARHTSFTGLWLAAFNKILSFKLMHKAYENIYEKKINDSGWVLFSYGRGEANFFVLNKEKTEFKSYFKSVGFTSYAEIDL